MTALSVAAEKTREWTKRRNAEIVKAKRSGQSLREIAGETGLAHTTIRLIVEQASQR